MPESPLDQDAAIYREMLAHPVLFTHTHPKKIAIICENDHGILQEALKHPNLEEIWHIAKQKATTKQDTRVKHYFGEVSEWLAQQKPNTLDILIATTPAQPEQLNAFLQKLCAEGILLQQSDSLFQPDILKNLHQTLLNTGFCDAQLLHFPHPVLGWQSAMMAIKQGSFNRVREKDIYNKSFMTHYYNFDMHKAALAIPEFMREKETI